MPDKVVVADASAVAALLFGEPRAEEISNRLLNAAIVAPTLLPYEVASVCLRKLKTHSERRDQLVAALSLLGRMKIRYIAVPPTDAVTLARTSRLTAYDAAYLWLARNLKVEVVTLDERLERVSRRTEP